MIEFAQMEPPYHEMSPMRVLLKIQKSDPPKLDRPSKWSREFNDFVRLCLVKDPNQRPRTEELLKVRKHAGHTCDLLLNSFVSPLAPLHTRRHRPEADPGAPGRVQGGDRGGGDHRPAGGHRGENTYIPQFSSIRCIHVSVLPTTLFTSSLTQHLGPNLLLLRCFYSIFMSPTNGQKTFLAAG